MQQKISFKLLPAEAEDDNVVKKIIAHSSGKKENAITGFHVLKQSIDARAKTIWVNLTVNAFIDEPFHQRPILPIVYKEVHHATHKVIIVGAGPAGLRFSLTRAGWAR